MKKIIPTIIAFCITILTLTACTPEEEYDEYLSLLAGEWEQDGSTPDNILDEMVHDYYFFRANGSGKYIQYRSSNGKIISNKEFTFTYDGELLTVQYTVEGDGNSYICSIKGNHMSLITNAYIYPDGHFNSNIASIERSFTRVTP